MINKYKSILIIYSVCILFGTVGVFGVEDFGDRISFRDVDFALSVSLAV